MLAPRATEFTVRLERNVARPPPLPRPRFGDTALVQVLAWVWRAQRRLALRDPLIRFLRGIAFIHGVGGHQLPFRNTWGQQTWLRLLCAALCKAGRRPTCQILTLHGDAPALPRKLPNRLRMLAAPPTPVQRTFLGPEESLDRVLDCVFWVRKQQCATFIAHHVALWLYKPEGPMGRKHCRLAEAVWREIAQTTQTKR